MQEHPLPRPGAHADTVDAQGHTLNSALVTGLAPGMSDNLGSAGLAALALLLSASNMLLDLQWTLSMLQLDAVPVWHSGLASTTL